MGLIINRKEVEKMPKWCPEYKRLYQQLYYRLKNDKITEDQYEIFILMKNKRAENRSVYHRKSSAIDTFKKQNLYKHTFIHKKLDKPILITFD